MKGKMMQSLIRQPLWVLLLALCCLNKAYGQTEAGTTILNQAAATYLDLNGVLQDVTSNQVRTLVRQVAGIDLVASQSKPGVPNGQVLFPHVLTNTGNGPDRYDICIAHNSGTFVLDSLIAYADEDEDGLPDSSTPIVDENLDGCYDSPILGAGESFNFVVVAVTPDLVASNQISEFEVGAFSRLNPTLVAINQDIVTLIDGPLIEVVKTLSDYRGYAGTGGYSVTLTYRNVGTEDATDVRIFDALPDIAVDGSTGDTLAGMIYTAGTGSWQQGDALDLTNNQIATLTENDDSNGQLGGGTPAVSVLYCAYQPGCTSPGFDPEQVTLVVDLVPVGQIGSVTFQFSVDSGYKDNDVLQNHAQFDYRSADGLTTFGLYASNTVNFIITDEVTNPAVVANSSDSSALVGVDDSLDADNLVSLTGVAQGEAALFTNYIWNAAPAGFDTFDIELDPANDRLGNPLGGNAFPAGTRFTLLREDGRTPLLDTNGNGIPDTGPLDAGEFAEIVVRADVPANIFGDNGGNGWQVTKIATSASDASLSNAVTDHLESINEGTVDLTNNAAGTLGAGVGPEVSPVTTLNLLPGTTGLFELWIVNTSSQPDNYQLQYSDQLPFTAGSLPAGWTIDLFLDSGAGDCSTSAGAFSSVVVLPGLANAKLVCAAVAIPDAEPPVTAQPIYFRVFSESTGAEDIKQDAVTIPAGPAILIENDQTGQTEPGGTVFYPHIITNVGNQNLECVNIQLTQSLASQGWTVSTYLDNDGSSTVSAGDVLLTPRSLAIGASFRIVLRVFAPSTASYGLLDEINVTVVGYPEGTGCGSGMVSDTNIDRTTTSNTDMKITKNQGPDLDCDGVIDGAVSNAAPTAPFSLDRFTVLPGQCVIYRLRATNQGVEPLFNAVVRDVVPSFTTYNSAAQSCQVSDADPCVFTTTPAHGDTLADIEVQSDEVRPSGIVTVFFGIQVE